MDVAACSTALLDFFSELDFEEEEVVEVVVVLVLVLVVEVVPPPRRRSRRFAASSSCFCGDISPSVIFYDRVEFN